MKNIRLLTLLMAMIIVACTPKDSNVVKLSEREEQRYDNALQKVEEIEAKYETLFSSDAPSYLKIEDLLTQAKEINYKYNANGMNELTMKYCNSLVERINDLQYKISLLLNKLLLSPVNINLVSTDDNLIDQATEYPLYLRSGEKLFYKIKAGSNITVRLYNADAERLIKTYNSKSVNDSLHIENNGIYLVEIVPNGKLYTGVKIDVRPVDVQSYHRPKVTSKQVECQKGDFKAVSVPGIEMHKCFDEVRKFTLRGQLKATFSGSAKALVAVQIPTGATDILYSLRIATSEQDRSSDGEFHENLATSYKKVRFLGLPLYEKEKKGNLNLFSKLLDDNRPLRDEDAYCNMYVFRNQSQAKEFQDGTKRASQLAYDVDYSTLGTQSCNGRIPTKGAKSIYLAFENERMRYANYIWVEVEAVTPNKVYYTNKYSIE